MFPTETSRVQIPPPPSKKKKKKAITLKKEKAITPSNLKISYWNFFFLALPLYTTRVHWGCAPLQFFNEIITKRTN
jgi:hypothetical protein